MVLHPQVEVDSRTSAAPAETPALELVGIVKRFGAVVANDRVDVAIRPGEIRGLVGENGAGKTTVMNVASGLYRADAGEIRIGGRAVNLRGPLDAIHHGVNMVHQNFLLAENLSAAENIVLGAKRGRRVLRSSDINRKVAALAERYGMPVAPGQPIWKMPLAMRQRVAILSALYRDCRVLILDEPTSVLSPPQIDTLLVTVRQLAAEGRSIVFITHKLREVVDLCDAVTVMRKGAVVGTFDRGEVDIESLAGLMVGRSLERQESLRSRATARPAVLQVAGLIVRGEHGERAVDDLSFELRSGEVLGVAGVDGNGQLELAAALAGSVQPESGSVTSEAASERPAVAYIPDDPRAEALAPGLSVVWNIGMRHYRSTAVGPWRSVVNFKQLRALASRVAAQFDVRGGGLDMPAASLSGGNLQKLLLARELSFGAPVIIAVNPTAGLDVASAGFVHGQLDEARHRGAAVLLVSSDLDEVLKLSDRVAVIYRGRFAPGTPSATISRPEIGRLMSGIGLMPTSASVS